jgi:hypothetical protein
MVGVIKGQTDSSGKTTNVPPPSLFPSYNSKDARNHNYVQTELFVHS